MMFPTNWGLLQGEEAKVIESVRQAGGHRATEKMTPGRTPRSQRRFRGLLSSSARFPDLIERNAIG